MVNFELSEKMKKGFFKSWQEHGTKEKNSMFMRNQTSGLQIPHSDALPLSHWATETLQWARPLQSIYFLNREVINVHANMMMIETGIYLQLSLATFN